MKWTGNLLKSWRTSCPKGRCDKMRFKALMYLLAFCCLTLGCQKSNSVAVDSARKEAGFTCTSPLAVLKVPLERKALGIAELIRSSTCRLTAERLVLNWSSFSSSLKVGRVRVSSSSRYSVSCAVAAASKSAGCVSICIFLSISASSLMCPILPKSRLFKSLICASAVGSLLCSTIAETSSRAASSPCRLDNDKFAWNKASASTFPDFFARSINDAKFSCIG